MPFESDSLQPFLNGPVSQLKAYQLPPVAMDTLYRWNLPPDTAVSSADTVHFCPSLFADHQLQVVEVRHERPSDGGITNFGTGVFCFILLVLSIVFVYQRRKITLLLQSLYSKRVAGQLLRESRLFSERIYLYSILIIMTVQAFFLLLLADRFFPALIVGTSYKVLFALLLLAVTADHYIKYVVSRVFADLFEYRSLMSLYKTNKFFHLTLASFMLFPLEVIAVYTGSNVPFLLYAAVFLVNYIYMIYNTVSLNSGKANWLLFFLYFCTVEILPYLVIVKFVLTLAAA